ncbi:MAG: DUF4288 domain-containing protein [Bacteroidetes bacterium]|nr:DUF4288 domain-containing protein [Bacteroidota bacterium]
MNWFLAKITYHIICGDGNHTPQFDEQLRLINAENELQAIQKAKQIGEKEQMCFLNNKQQLVQWKFIGVTEVNVMPALMDGAEVYSRICEVDNEQEYLNTIRLRNSHLLCDQVKKSFQKKTLCSHAAGMV